MGRSMKPYTSDLFDRATAHKQDRADRATLNAYRCRFCHGWHIGRGK